MATILHDGVEHPGLASRLITLTPNEIYQEFEAQGDLTGKPWQYAVNYLTNKAKTFLTSGWQEPGRHEAAWHTAKRLQESGVTIEEARKALYWGNGMCRDGAGESAPLKKHEIEHALKTAYGG
jgi:hypothetical protein